MSPPPNQSSNPLRLIAGSGRSGTTWVLDAVAEANNLRPVFEPLHPESSAVGDDFGYSYLTGETSSERLKAYFTAIAESRQRDVWTSYRIRPARLKVSRSNLRSIAHAKNYVRIWTVFARRLLAYRAQERRSTVLLKCIRANLMLDWIQKNFDARIVLMMRHPCAVIESQLRFPEHWDPYRLLERYQRDALLMQGPLATRKDILAQDLNRASALTAIWCIENLIPASQAAENGYGIVFYEELLERPDKEWARIVAGLDLSSIPDEGLLRVPSQQSAVRLQKQEAGANAYTEAYSSWRNRLSAADLEHVRTILQAFGVDFYSVEAGRPDTVSFSRRYRAYDDGVVQ